MPLAVKELIGDEDNQSEYSSDSDQEYQYSASAERKKTILAPKKTKLSLDDTIQDINTKIEAGDEINLADPAYPLLFVVHYRGFHYFSQFFDQAKRRSTRTRIKNNDFNDSVYSAAIYDLAELKLAEPIDTPDKKARIRQAKEKLKEGFDTLSSTAAKQKAWWGYNRQHDKLIYQHYHRFANDYKKFRDESDKAFYDCYKVLPSKKNPYISSADEARHAVLYAIGGKAELSQGVFRPAYQSSGKAKHPKVGYVQIIFHTLSELAKSKPLSLSVLQAENKIDIKDRQLNERETTYKGWITAKHIMFTQQVRFPSFNKTFDSAFHSKKYGIPASGSYTRYRNTLANQNGNTTLLDKLAEHYALQLQQEAQRIAEELGGHIVFLGLNGKLQKNLPTTLDVRTVRKNQTLVDNSLFDENLATFELKNDPDTDSDEEFPSLKDKKVTSTAPLKPPKFLMGKLDDEKIFFEENQIIRDGNCGFTAIGTNRAELRETLQNRLGIAIECQSLHDELHEFISNLDDETLDILNSQPIQQAHQLYLAHQIAEQHANDKLSPGNEYLQNLIKQPAAIPFAPSESVDMLITAMTSHVGKNDANLLELQQLCQTRNLAHQTYTDFLTSEPLVRAYLDAFVNTDLPAEKQLWLGYQTAKWYAKTKGISVYIWQNDPEHPDHLILKDHHKAPAKPGLAIYHLLHTEESTHFNLLSITSPINVAHYKTTLSTKPTPISATMAATHTTLFHPNKNSSSVSTTKELAAAASQGIMDGEQKIPDESKKLPTNPSATHSNTFTAPKNKK